MSLRRLWCVVAVAASCAAHNVTDEDLLLPDMETGNSTIRAASGLFSTRKNVRGTMWADQTDRGGCQMPQTQYRIHHAVALGEQPSLGRIKISHSICGQVVEVWCGGSKVKAVVASSCNLGTPSCGVDLIRKSWNKATGGKPPGISKCTVRLTRKRAMKGSRNQCFHRPDSDSHNWYQSVGLFNTKGKLVKSAKLANSVGRFNGGSSGYFDFHFNGVLFKPSQDLTFTFEDGSKKRMKLRDCKKSFGKVKIWK